MVIAFPTALVQVIRVVMVDLGDIMAAFGPLFTGAITFGGLCSGWIPVSSRF